MDGWSIDFAVGLSAEPPWPSSLLRLTIPHCRLDRIHRRPRREQEFTEYRTATIFCGTYNVNAKVRIILQLS